MRNGLDLHIVRNAGRQIDSRIGTLRQQEHPPTSARQSALDGRQKTFEIATAAASRISCGNEQDFRCHIPSKLPWLTPASAAPVPLSALSCERDTQCDLMQRTNRGNSG